MLYLQEDTKLKFQVIERAVIYARVSSDDRAKTDGLNLESQLEMCQQYAREKGYRVIEPLAEDDRGASGAEFDLPMLNKMLEMAYNQEFDVLIVREMDRLSRNLGKQLYLEEELKKCGIRIEYVLEAYDSTPEGLLSKNVRGVIAEYERLKIAQRLSRGRKNKAKKGKVLCVGKGGPYGYNPTEDRDYLEINGIEAKVIRLIFDLYVNERLKLRAICRKLNDLNIPSPGQKRGRKSAKGWVQPTLSRLLKNETYVGRWYFGRTRREKVNGRYRQIKNPKSEWIMVNIPAIIDEVTFNQAQTLLRENKRKAKRNRVHDYLFSGHITCGLCGYRAMGKYNISRGNKYFYYICGCRNDKQLRKVNCDLPFFPGVKVDDIVWQWMKKLLENPDSLKDGLGNYEKNREKELEPMLRRLKTTNELIEKSRHKWDRLIDAYLEGVIDKRTVESRKSELEAAINGLEEEKANLESHVEANAISDEHIAYLKKLAENHALRGLELADNHYETQRKLVEVLNIEVRMTIEDSQKVIYVSCAFDEDRFAVDNGTLG